MRLTFFGAVREVGRSCILLESRNAKVIIDAGVKLGEVEQHPEIDDSMLKSVDAVVISHAHLDHCGYLAHLFSYGYSGPVYATKPTLELINVMISDYLRISKPKGVSKDVVAKMARHYKAIEYNKEFSIKDIKIKFVQAGHVLGSAMLLIECEGKRLVYSGDVNLKGTRLLSPAEVERIGADVLLVESTYGGKGDVFPSEKKTLNEMVASLKETINKGGKIIIPTFAVGRGQEVLFLLDDYIRSGVLPHVPIYIDGMINKAMRIYRHNVIYCRDELQKRILMSEDDPFKSKNFVEVKGKQHRNEIMKSEESCIIVTTSGMIKGGPVIAYLKKLAGVQKDKLILVGYQAAGTPGREIDDGAKEVELDGRKVEIKLKVENFHLSGHADRPQLLRLIEKVNPKKIFVMHGEEGKSKEFAESLKGRYETILPEIGKSYEI